MNRSFKEFGDNNCNFYGHFEHIVTQNILLANKFECDQTINSKIIDKPVRDENAHSVKMKMYSNK